jgi:hypothetical protein
MHNPSEPTTVSGIAADVSKIIERTSVAVVGTTPHMGEVQLTHDPVQSLGIKRQDTIDGVLIFLECEGIRRHADRRETKEPSTAGAAALASLPHPIPAIHLEGRRVAKLMRVCRRIADGSRDR